MSADDPYAGMFDEESDEPKDAKGGASGANSGQQQGATGQAGADESSIPTDTMDVIINGVADEHARVLWNVVMVLKRRAFAVDDIVALLKKYPDGIAKKYRGRLRDEIERIYRKIEDGEASAKAKRDLRKQGDTIIRTGGNYMDNKIPLAGNLANALLALEQEPELVGVFGYDEMLRTEVLLRALLNHDPNFKPRPVTDADVARVQEHLQWLGFRKIGKDTTHDAINTHARTHSFHPIRNYLDSLKWDGEERLRTWLHVYFGAEQNEYTQGIGTMFPISMLARIYQPGCKCDYMPILEGPQGLIKSLGCKALAGEEYFSDQLSDITKKDASQHLRGKWVLELAELHTYNRADVDHFKAFV